MTAATISAPDQHGRITVTTDTCRIEIRPRRHYEPMPTAVYVADSVAHAADPELARLDAEESALGKRRFSTRGEHADVDALYDRLNARIAETKLRIARDLLPAVAAVVSGDTSPEALDTLRFSAYAGCDMCSCSPGVVVPMALAIDDDRVDIWVKPLNDN